jgi:hypothetical protein
MDSFSRQKAARETGQSGVILAALCRDELLRLHGRQEGRTDAPPALASARTVSTIR